MLFFNLAALSALTALTAAIPAGHLHHQHKRSDDASSTLAKGICYTPYSDDGGCKSESQIKSELATVSDYEIIRLYGTDCDQVANVLKHKGDSQKLFLGVYSPSQLSDEISTIKSAIEAHGSWDDVHTVSIGNELVNGNQATVAQVGEYVTSAKSALKEAGYSGDVVSVDTFIAVINNPGLCEHSDYIAVNAHAYFDGGYTAEQAGEWLLSQIQRVWTACDGKKNVFVTESGWPSQGQTYKLAVPSKSNQKAAIKNIIEKAGNSTIVFTTLNDLWKADGEYGVEKYWGIYSD